MSQYKCKNQEGFRGDTMQKTVDTRRHCEVELGTYDNLPQPPKTEMWGGDCGRLLHALTPMSQCLLVSIVLAQCHLYILLHFS